MEVSEGSEQIPATTTLPIADVERMIFLLGRIAGMQTAVADRRRALILGICDLIDADIWMWIHSRLDPVNFTPTAFKLADGGWASDAERAGFLTALHESELNATIIPKQIVSIHNTVVRQDLLSESNAHELKVLNRWSQLSGMREAITSCYPLDPRTISALGFHRRAGKPPFTDRERCMVHIITSQIDWLHRAETDVPANTDKLLELSPRQREVLVHLMSGDSRKQIAGKLKLSEHTIADHMKAIYSNFNVNSRGELLSLFMSGGKR
jgi:DNA-binding CsgD family transcriptional regulator